MRIKLTVICLFLIFMPATCSQPLKIANTGVLASSALYELIELFLPM
jgi:hypothetical protein